MAREAGKPVRCRRGSARAANTFKVAAEETKRIGEVIYRLAALARRLGITRPSHRAGGGCLPFNFPLSLAAHKSRRP
jgi:acyl-CoA reductase-like NAD-dependent aldehyde dehydrogenase